MSWLDWTLVIVLNGSIVAYGLFRGRDTKSSSDWFLAGRTLPWWMVGLSLYATAIDSSDLVADSGGTYALGLRYIVTNWVGTVAGWVLLAHFVALPMYRAGMYTNAEYLEARFGPATRVISALVQVQYRTLVLGIIATTIYLTLAIICDWGLAAWWAVGAIALVATIYTAWGGLKSVAVTDAWQSIVMVAASLTLFAVVWNAVEGWSGIERRLQAQQPDLPAHMLHVGNDHVETLDATNWTEVELARQLLLGGDYDPQSATLVRRTPSWLVCLAFVILGAAYSIVNHTQSMRLFGRTEWDLKMSVVVSGAILIAATFVNLMIGVMGRALYPETSAMPLAAHLQTQDAIYPLVVREVTSFGFKGVVLAGILAASMSTYDSIGSTLSALLTRDVYGRLIVRDRDDHHYLRVGQWLTPVVIFGSFLYVPFLLRQGMLQFYMELVGAFVVPLLTVYLLGIFTRVHRRSGAIGLLTGVAYGVWRLLAGPVAVHFGVAIMPAWLTNSFGAYVYSLLITAGSMLIVSLFTGWQPPGELLHDETAPWLKASQAQVRQLDQGGAAARSNFWPATLGLAIVAVGVVLSFYVFW